MALEPLKTQITKFLNSFPTETQNVKRHLMNLKNLENGQLRVLLRNNWKKEFWVLYQI